MIGRATLVLIAMLALAQRPAAPPPGTPDSDVQVYRVDKFGRVDWLATFPRAGVPALARLADGRLMAAYQSFPDNDSTAFDRVAVRFSSDEGKTWTDAQVIRLTGWPSGMRAPFDPAIVPLPDKRVRLYFTSVAIPGPDVPAIFSAISTDGIAYEAEPGRRFAIEGKPVIDAAVVLHRGTFHLYAPRSEELGYGYHASSKDGLAFLREDDVKMDGARRWLGAAVSDGDSLTFFGTGEPDAQGPRLPSAIGAQPPAGAPRPVPQLARKGGTIWAATSRNGRSWQPSDAPPIPGVDPGAVAAKDGGWIFVVTGSPRNNATVGAGNAPASPSVPGAPAVPPDGGLRNHRLLVATSADGMAWTLSLEVFAERASAPALFEGPDGRLIALFMDASNPGGGLSASVERTDGTWERRATSLRGSDPNVVRLRDGSYRAYTRDRDGTIVVFSSTDGLGWIALGLAFRSIDYPNATAPDVFDTGRGWVMLLSVGRQLLRATSADGLTFTSTGVADLGGSISNTVMVSGGWRTYFHAYPSLQNGGRMTVRSAFTTDGAGWRVEPGNRLVAPETGPAQFGVGDPAPVRRSNGPWVMLVKSFIEQPGR